MSSFGNSPWPPRSTVIYCLAGWRTKSLKRRRLQPTHSAVLAFSSGQRSVRHTILEDMSVRRYPADHQADRSLLRHRHAGRASTGHWRDTKRRYLDTTRNIQLHIKPLLSHTGRLFLQQDSIKNIIKCDRTIIQKAIKGSVKSNWIKQTVQSNKEKLQHEEYG